MNDDDPMDDIESEHTHFSFGQMGAQVYAGALAQTNSRYKALLVTCAFFFGMFKANQPDDEDE